MALLTWKIDYSVGVKTIDSQHRTLFDIVNELHTAMMNGQAQGIAGSLLGKLVKYTRDHFASEEKMMAATSYPGLARHRTRHLDLIKQVDEFMARHERGDVTINIHLLRFLGDWLTKHIQHEDKEYGPWLNQHGVQ